MPPGKTAEERGVYGINTHELSKNGYTWSRSFFSPSMIQNK